MDLRNAYNLHTLASVLGCSAKQLGFYVYRRSISAQYKKFDIPKRRGGFRTISAPTTNLKIIQRRIARELETLITFKPCVSGFVTGRDIRRNASFHARQRYVLNIDLEDFFGSINYGRVYGLLSKVPYEIHPTVAAAIAKACILDNALPQGAPSSPTISNLICAKMDSELTRLARAHRCIYTRYADDITFSTNRSTMPLVSIDRNADNVLFVEISAELRMIIERNGFRINQKKVRLSDETHRQEVTGLIVNEKINVKRRLIREIRAMLHAWRKFGLPNAQAAFESNFGGVSDFAECVRGKIEFVGQIRGRSDKVFRKLADQFNQLSVARTIRTVLTPEEVTKQAVWVIEHDGPDQGTAFFVEHFGLVTCAHCLGSNPYVYHPTDHTKRFPVNVEAIDEDRDLALLNVPEELSSVQRIPVYNGPPVTDGSAAVLCGYPNHFAARPLRMEPGIVVAPERPDTVTSFRELR
jgi:RNA-directed DNA polymerase